MSQNLKAVDNPLSLNGNVNIVSDFGASYLEFLNESLYSFCLRLSVLKFSEGIVSFFPVTFDSEESVKLFSSFLRPLVNCLRDFALTD